MFIFYNIGVKYRFWIKYNKPKLGDIQIINVDIDKNIFIVNMIGQKNIYYKNGIPPIRYQAVRKCLQNLVKEMVFIGFTNSNSSIHMPKLGCGLAGGK